MALTPSDLILLGAVRRTDSADRTLALFARDDRLVAGLLRDSVVLSCASWCQLQRASFGRWLKLRLIFSIYRSHNAGVEGSSPSLSTNPISVLAIGPPNCRLAVSAENRTSPFSIKKSRCFRLRL